MDTRPNILHIKTTWDQICRLSRALCKRLGSTPLADKGVPEFKRLRVYDGGIRLDLVYTFESPEKPQGRVTFLGSHVTPVDDNRDPTDASGAEYHQGWSREQLRSVIWNGEGYSSLLAEVQPDGTWLLKFIGDLEEGARRETLIFWPLIEIDWLSVVRSEINRPLLFSALLSSPKGPTKAT